MRHAHERALALGFGGQQPPIDEGFEFVDHDGAREIVQE